MHERFDHLKAAEYLELFLSIETSSSVPRQKAKEALSKLLAEQIRWKKEEKGILMKFVRKVKLFKLQDPQVEEIRAHILYKTQHLYEAAEQLDKCLKQYPERR